MADQEMTAEEKKESVDVGGNVIKGVLKAVPGAGQVVDKITGPTKEGIDILKEVDQDLDIQDHTGPAPSPSPQVPILSTEIGGGGRPEELEKKELP